MPGRCAADYARSHARGGLALLTVLALLAVSAVSSAFAQPRDRDHDGLSNRFELNRSHTNPTRADTDSDGLRDRFELRRSRTNPRRRDTDGDGASDRKELRRGTNPRRKPRRRPQAASTFPTPASTGVPSGWQPSTTREGNVTVTQAGRVIDGWLVTGSIEVRAPNVTIRNSRVHGRIYNQAANRVFNGLLVEDTEIGPESGNSEETSGALGVGGYVARRVHIHNSPEGFRVGGYNNSGGEAGPVAIEDSYAKLDNSTGCAHSDGVQGYDEPRSTRIHHNTIDMAGMPCTTAPIYVGNDNPSTITVTDNLIMGGSYTLRLHNDGPGISYPTVTGNRLVDGAWDWGPVVVDTCAVIGTWADNRLVTIDGAYNVTSLRRPINRC